MRTTIQTKLEELNDNPYYHIEIGKVISDDIIVENTTYFGYEISENYMNSDMDRNYTKRVNIIGYVTRLVNPIENTQDIVDTATDNIIDKLKELNFKCSSRDITLTDDVVKTQITGYTEYNEINNKFIV
jgi:hypothetical protein